jgi:hypothetical protein
MNYVRKVLSSLGGIFLAALLIAAVAPKAARGVAAAFVQVVNTPADPVVTTDSLGTATLLQVNCSVSSEIGLAGNFTSQTCFTVPAGKRAIVENVDGSCFTQNGAAINVLFLVVNVPLQEIGHPVPLHFEGLTPFNINLYDYNSPVRIYADPGQAITTKFTTSDATGGSLCQTNISGRLVPTT